MPVWALILFWSLIAVCLGYSLYVIVGSIRGLRQLSVQRFEFEHLMLRKQVVFADLSKAIDQLGRTDNDA